MNKLIQPPIFIIGAGRSGTNILRDSLTSFSNIITWPCDEINLVFRHGNRTMLHDEFGKEHVNKIARQYILKTFEQLQTKNNARILEKTCANTLRVPFVDEIFPEAKFIFIVRDGYDVAASAVKRWKAPIEPAYLWKKIQYVPKSDIPFYALQFIRNRYAQWRSQENKQGKWGPIYRGMEQDLQKLTLPEVAAKQWARCVEKASTDLNGLDSDRVYAITYEDFVQSPAESVHGIKNWLNEAWSTEEIENAVRKVSVSSLRKGQQHFTPVELERIGKIIDPVMKDIYDPIAKNNQKGI